MKCLTLTQFLFNNLVNPPSFLLPSTSDGHVPRTANSAAAGDADEERGLLAEQALEETAVLPADLGASGYDVVPQKTVAHERSE